MWNSFISGMNLSLQGRESESSILLIPIDFLYIRVKMEHWIFVKIAIKNDLENNKIACKLVKHYEQDALSYLQVSHQEWQFFMDHEEVNNAGRSGKHLDLLYHIWIQNFLVLEAILLVKNLANIMKYSYQLSFCLNLRSWIPIPELMMSSQFAHGEIKVQCIQLANMLTISIWKTIYRN
jgi:hypothetical protein